MPLLAPGDLPDPGIEHGSPVLQADSLPTDLPGKPYTRVCLCVCVCVCVCVYKMQYYGSKSGKEYIKSIYSYPAYLTFVQSTS